MGVRVKRITLKNHFQPDTYAALGQFSTVKAGFVQRLYIQNTYPVNPFHSNYPYCRGLPENLGNVYGWVFLEKSSEVLGTVAFLNVVCFCLNGISYLLDDPHKIVLLCPFPMFGCGYCRTAQNVHVFLYQFRHTRLLHFYHHLRAVSQRTSINLPDRRNTNRLRVKLAEYLFGRTT